MLKARGNRIASKKQFARGFVPRYGDYGELSVCCCSVSCGGKKRINGMMLIMKNVLKNIGVEFGQSQNNQ